MVHGKLRFRPTLCVHCVNMFPLCVVCMLSLLCGGQSNCRRSKEHCSQISVSVTSINTYGHQSSITHALSPPFTLPGFSSLLSPLSPSHSVNHLCSVPACRSAAVWGFLPCEGNCMSDRQSCCKTSGYQIMPDLRNDAYCDVQGSTTKQVHFRAAFCMCALPTSTHMKANMIYSFDLVCMPSEYCSVSRHTVKIKAEVVQLCLSRRT